MGEKKAKGFHALEKKIHELEDEERAARGSESVEGGELIELDEREKAVATAPPSHDE